MLLYCYSYLNNFCFYFYLVLKYDVLSRWELLNIVIRCLSIVSAGYQENELVK